MHRTWMKNPDECGDGREKLRQDAEMVSIFSAQELRLLRRGRGIPLGMLVPWETLETDQLSLVDQSLRHPTLSIPRTAACQASLSFTISRNLLKFMSTGTIIPRLPR